MTTQLSTTEAKTSYDQDFNLWRETIIEQIQERRFDEVDWEHLLQELEDMGKSDKRTFVSNLVVLIAHLLKLKVQSDAPHKMKHSWYNSIDEHRDRVRQDLLENPSFQGFLIQSLSEAYPRAQKLAIKESKRAAFGVRKPSDNEYPQSCPFTAKQILDDDFYGN